MSTSSNYFSKDIKFIKHINGAPLFTHFGIGPNFIARRGIIQLQKLFEKNTFWAKGRSLNEIKKMINNSSSIITVWKREKLIGFGRATSDQVFRAVLWDIVVENKFQNLGIGKFIVKSLLESKSVSNVKKVYLMTTHFEEFYKSCGFSIISRQKCLLMSDHSDNIIKVNNKN